MHYNSLLLYRKHALGPMLEHLRGTEGRVLEIGPDVVPSLYEQDVALELKKPSLRLDTIDLDEGGWENLKNLKTTYRAFGEYDLGLLDNDFDIVISGQVIEHVRKIWVWMRELARVTKPGGLVVTIGPMSWEYHEAPVDCWRIYPEGMRALYDDAGLDVIVSECESLDGSVRDTVTVGRKRTN